jgi:hypothetical protein
MVIDDLNLICIPAIKAKTDPPLIVDANAPLSYTVIRQCLQSIGWRKAQILDPRGRIQLYKTHGSTLEDCRR